MMRRDIPTRDINIPADVGDVSDSHIRLIIALTFLLWHKFPAVTVMTRTRF